VTEGFQWNSLQTLGRSHPEISGGADGERTDPVRLEQIEVPAARSYAHRHEGSREHSFALL